MVFDYYTGLPHKDIVVPKIVFVSCMHHMYIIFILAVDSSSLLHKLLHNIVMATFGCIV